jgi:hypothetical protein
MRSFRVAVVMLTISLAGVLAGCTANKDIEKFADRACACTDKDCASKVADEIADWLLKNQNARGDETKAQADFERMGKCFLEKNADLTKFAAAVKTVTENQ